MHDLLYDKISRPFDLIFKGSSEVAFTSCTVIYSVDLFMKSIMQSIWSLCISAQPTIYQQDVSLPGAIQEWIRAFLPTVPFTMNYLRKLAQTLEIQRCRLYFACQKKSATDGRSCLRPQNVYENTGMLVFKDTLYKRGSQTAQAGILWRRVQNHGQRILVWLLKDTLELSVRSLAVSMGVMQWERI